MWRQSFDTMYWKCIKIIWYQRCYGEERIVCHPSHEQGMLNIKTHSTTRISYIFICSSHSSTDYMCYFLVTYNRSYLKDWKMFLNARAFHQKVRFQTLNANFGCIQFCNCGSNIGWMYIPMWFGAMAFSECNQNNVKRLKDVIECAECFVYFPLATVEAFGIVNSILFLC